MHAIRLVQPPTSSDARCQVSAAEARILAGNEIVAHRQLFRLDEQPRDLELRAPRERAAVLLECSDGLVHATLFARESALLEIDLRVDGVARTETAIEVLAAGSGTRATAAIVDANGGEVAIDPTGLAPAPVESAEKGLIRLAPGQFVLRAEVAGGILMLRLRLSM